MLWPATMAANVGGRRTTVLTMRLEGMPNNADLAMANGVLAGFAAGPVSGLEFAYSGSTH